jgi:hypothetical protein
VNQPIPKTGSDPALSSAQLAARGVWLAVLRQQAASVTAQLDFGQWNFLADEALRYQLGGLTYRLLTDGPLAERVPGPVQQRLRAQYVDSAVQNAVYLRGTRGIAAALTGAGIPVLLLKGVHLCRFVYAEPALRSMADVDLMVPRDRLAEAERIVLALGYGPVPRPDLEEFCSRWHHLAKLYKPGAPVLEVHWTIERPVSPFRIDLAGLWSRARPAILEGVPVLLLAPEDLLLHVALHGSYHHGFNWSALKGVVDLDVVVAKHGAELDWDALAERANAWGVSGFIYTALRLATTILHTPVPAPVFDALRHEPADDAVVELARRHVLSTHLELPETYLALARDRGLRGRWKLLRHAVFLPREAMERLYGPRRGAAALYPSFLRRVVDLLGRRSRLLFQALLKTKTLHSALEREANRDQIKSWVKRASGGRMSIGPEPK